MPELDLGSGDTSGNKTNFLCLRVYGWRKQTVNKSKDEYTIHQVVVTAMWKKMSQGKKDEGPLISYIRWSRGVRVAQ